MASSSTSRGFIDLYKTLSVTPKATTAQIKTAFFKLAKTCHPDVNKSSDSDYKFKQINDAYQTLTKDRTAYDTDYARHKGSTTTVPFTSTTYSGSSFTQSATPFDDINASAFQWGKAWVQDAKKEKKTSEQKKSHSTKQQQHKETCFDERFFWQKNNMESDLNSMYEGSGKRNNRNDTYIICEDESDDEADDDEVEYDFYEFVSERKKFAQRKGRKWKDPSADYTKKYNYENGKLQNRLTRKILQRMMESPRRSDIPLLKKFGLDPQLFGLREGDENSSDENGKSEIHSKMKKSPTNRGADPEHDHKQRNSEVDSEDLTESDFDESDMEDSDLFYDFAEDKFKCKNKTPKKKKRAKIERDESYECDMETKQDNKGSNTRKNETNKEDEKRLKSEPVSIFTLASKRMHHNSDIGNKQPVMSHSHKEHGNRIEDEFFLNKKHVFDW